MARYGYPPTTDQIRRTVQALRELPADAPEWVPFMRDVIRVPMWMHPAVHAAIQQEGWATAADPLEKIRSDVRRLAIDMKLSNSEKPGIAELLNPASDDPAI